MSWLSQVVKKISKIQPGKILVNAAKNIAGTIPVIGGLFQQAQQTVEQAQQTIGNVNQAAQDTSKTSKYIIWGIVAVVVILILILVLRRK